MYLGRGATVCFALAVKSICDVVQQQVNAIELSQLCGVRQLKKCLACAFLRVHGLGHRYVLHIGVPIPFLKPCGHATINGSHFVV